jgi:hypothetical protein
VQAPDTFPPPRLTLGLVTTVTEQTCRLVADGGIGVVEFAEFFPGPRIERVCPGHLVAIASVGAGERVVWRWFDAVVVGGEGQSPLLWETSHGVVRAVPRDESVEYPLGGRAYMSAGLPGAEWWVEGRAVDRSEEANVDLDLVGAFLAEHGLVDFS